MRIISFLVLFSSFFLVSCASLQPSSRNPYVWPKPPDTARVAYEYTLKNKYSLQPLNNETRLKALATGQSTRQQAGMLKPYDVAASQGLVVVTDSLMAVAHVFDIKRKKMFAIGWRKEGKLGKPLGVAMDAEQNIYIVDAGRGAVVKYDRLGLYLNTIGQKKDFSRISDVAVTGDGKKIYVLDRGGVDSMKHQIIVYDARGQKIDVIGSRGHKAGQFNHPTQLALNLKGDIFVLDAGNFRVQVFDANGKYQRQWGRPGNKIGNFARPRGIAVDDENRVYVSDAAYQNFQIFNENGQLLLSIGEGGGKDEPGHYLLPAGIAVDETQRIYLVDQIRKKVEVLRVLSSGE